MSTVIESHAQDKARERIAAVLSREALLAPNEHGVVRLPVLIGGELVVPEDVSYADIERALGEHHYAETANVQLVKTEALTRNGESSADGRLVFVLPRITEPRRLSHTNTDELVAELYSLSAADTAQYLDRVSAAIGGCSALAEPLLELTSRISGAPRQYLEAALSAGGLADVDSILAAVDRELAFGPHPGSHCLDGWVPLIATKGHGVSAHLARSLHELPLSGYDSPQLVRAFPTRQLHITAGNSPVVPLISAFRALALKSALTLKMPSGALAGGAALAVAMHAVEPEHPLTRFASVAYWRGGDERIEGPLLAAGMFDRIVVWGDTTAVVSIAARAPLTKTLTFNPRYGVSLIGADALTPGCFDETVRRAVTDVMVENQKACIASLVLYVEADTSTATRFATAVSTELKRWDEEYPSRVPPDVYAKVRQARRGGLRFGDWHPNGNPAAPDSAAVVMDGDLDVSAHPMSRVAVIRPVADLDEVIDRLHASVSQVGIAPESQRRLLRERICARGVTAVLPLGEADRAGWSGVPHDGHLPLSELVSWVTA